MDSKLTTVTIPSTVVEIGNWAFYTNSLQEIRINRKSADGITFGNGWKPDNVVVKYVGK